MTTPQMLAAAFLICASAASPALAETARPRLLTTYLTYRDGEKKPDIYKLYVALSPKGDVLVSTVGTANFYASNKSQSGVTIEGGNGSKCRGYSIQQTRGQLRTEGKLCVDVNMLHQESYSMHVSIDEVSDTVHRAKKNFNFKISASDGKCAVEPTSVSISNVLVGKPDDWVSGHDLSARCNATTP
jgi:hypothetical protein